MVRLMDRIETQAPSFNAIRISIASPEQIMNWSHGEVTKPETINYRTLRPEKDGLFCERLFGPTKDWECFCGKYKRIRYRGVVCDRCGVEVTRSKVRRERMGHIKLAAPVAHIWFSKTTPSRLGLLLDLSPRNLERVLYFAQHIVISVDDEKRQELIEEAQVKRDFDLDQARQDAEEDRSPAQARLDAVNAGADSPEAEAERMAIQAELDALHDKLDKEQREIEETFQNIVDDLESLHVYLLLSESRHRELKDKYPGVFEDGMGAKAIQYLLRDIDLEALRGQLVNEMHSTSGQRRKKAIKRLRVVESFRNSGNRVEDMILTILPVLPPELRPMVQLDGGRFATSDLNDLYRRVINRNNRLKRLMDLGAPEIIIRNEQRMLQEAVDALIDNGRRGRPIQGSHNHKLKSLSDLLRGKQGRFRQNLLGKRVDYSGRSVIVVGPELKMHECGLPKRMALELFKPFVMHRLVMLGIAPNIKNAKRMVERARPEVWDILEDVIRDRPVLLNRAPTLHRLGIQAFMPVLIEGNAIQIHPLVCSAFNADFDGDQMAVHVPLSRMAVLEAKEGMLSTRNMLSPASGDPLVAPTLDMVMGCYYLTEERREANGAGREFYDFNEASIAHSAGLVDLQASIRVRNVDREVENPNPDGSLDTTLGRMIFNDILPSSLAYRNKLMDRGGLKDLTSDLHRFLSNDETSDVLDKIKDLGFRYATNSGITIAINDIQVPSKKPEILSQAAEMVSQYEDDYLNGLISEDERYTKTVDAWTDASDRTEKLVEEEMDNYGGIAMMARSGTKGNISQIKQMAGMRGLMSNPRGRIIDLPIVSSFREGLTALEYFISTHGARKGLADTALRTADSGYLTRRLIDIAQEVIILEDDCGTYDAHFVSERPDDPSHESLKDRIIGRMAAIPVVDPATGEILVDRNADINEQVAEAIVAAGVTEVGVRSPLTCECQRGVCRMCYGRLPATGETVQEGQAVGIIAAQSIGEPGTQLTMRTFHTGGIAGQDITSGLPRVEELFEARVPKNASILADIDGVVSIETDGEDRRLRVLSREEFPTHYALPEGAEVLVEVDEPVGPGMVLAAGPQPELDEPADDADDAQGDSEPDDPQAQIIAEVDGFPYGRVSEITEDRITVVWEDTESREYIVAPSDQLLAAEGDSVNAGDPLTRGALPPHNPQNLGGKNGILEILGTEALQTHLIDEVQKVYQSQGVSIHDKHIEVILRQMLRRVRVELAGDCDLIPGDTVDRFEFQEKNARVLAEGGEPATATPVLLGVTRASLRTDSFLSAASFQETTRVLTEAAVSGAHDTLQGLKENVIIGRLIPARVQIPGMDALLAPEPAPELAGIAPGGWLGLGGDGGASPLDMEDGVHQTPDDDFFGLEEDYEEDDDGPVDAGFLSERPEDSATSNGGQFLGGDGDNLGQDTITYNPFAAPEDGSGG